jgi:hypothetical protein
MSNIPIAQPASVQGTVVGVTPPPGSSGGNDIDTFIANQQLYFFRYAPNEVVRVIPKGDKETSFEMTKIYVMLANSPTEVIPMLSIAPVEDWRNPVTGFVRYNYVNCSPDGYKNYMPKYDYSTQNVQMDCRYTLITSRSEVSEDGWKKLTTGILFKLGKLGNSALRSPLAAASVVGTGTAMGARALGTALAPVGKALAPIARTTGSIVGNVLTLGALNRMGGGRTRRRGKKNRKTRKQYKK